MPTNLHPPKKEPTIDEYGIAIDQEVDLGFPSGTIWAGWNLGATMPEEFGDYYACGETETKTEYLCLIIAIGLTKTKMVI